jgi:Zn-dependent protease with chaperone function
MNDADRALTAMLLVVIVVGLAAGFPAASADDTVSLNGYAEWKKNGVLIVDGQRVSADETTKWKGRYRRLEHVPLGDEVRVAGGRTLDGAVFAREIDVRPNQDDALFESDVQRGTAELEGLWLQAGVAFDADQHGRRKNIGEIERDGPGVERVRRLVDRLAPPYVGQNGLRAYVIDNKEWNAMAMGNGAIWVFRGIMDDMSDNELAIVVGHELAHYTHEHSRRQMRRGVWTQLAGLSAILAASAIDNNALRASAQAGAALTMSAITNGYGRDLEDQADRVGLRYAHEAGFPVAGAPAVWGRFLQKYGQEDRVTNFFFSDHSRASSRQKNLERELALNYR